MPEIKLLKTPAKEGYSMPAEWEKHEGTLLAWPHNKITWPDVKKVEGAWASMVEALHKGERIYLLVKDKKGEKHIIDVLDGRVDMKKITFLHIPTADVWLRDSAPIFVLHGRQRAAVNWTFNAWGEKYDDLLEDKGMSDKISNVLGEKSFVPGIVLEGGSIDVNGRGTLLTTEQCLLNKNRNSRLSKKEIEQYLKSYLGVTHIIWLKEGVVGDDTDGHVDDIARFVNPTTVICMVEEDTNDENYLALKENYEILKKSVDQDGRPLTVIPVPMPHAVSDDEGRLPASYANFYIGNDAVIVPVFGDVRDKHALALFRTLFPGKKVVGV
jgi:agmatine deiminase